MKSSPRELIVVANPRARLRVTPDGLTSREGGKELQQRLQLLKDILLSEHATLRPLYGVSEDQLEDRWADKAELFPEPALTPSLYYRVTAPDESLKTLVNALRSDEFSELIDTAYIQPGAEPPISGSAVLERPELNPRISANPNCDFTNDQDYLLPGEFGINAQAAWTMPGGEGDGIKMIDVEGAWFSTHLDLIDKQVRLLGGVEVSDRIWRNHGTAVLGLLSASVNGFGIRGICPKACVNVFSIFDSPSSTIATISGVSTAIFRAADVLTAGDVLVIEVHLPGPEAAFQPNNTQLGYIPVEWWPSCQLAVLYATHERNVTVISAGGNGRVCLDSPVYDEPPQEVDHHFPTGWHNPFRRNPIDTESIIVGAGAPPNGHHSSGLGPGRSRLSISNYGCMVDAQAWGAEVTSTGYKALCGTEEELYYTTSFGGTSSATAIVAGAVACIQGIRKAAGQTPLSSKQVRKVLRETGKPQVDFPTANPPRPKAQRIGNLPDLEEMIQKMNELWP